MTKTTDVVNRQTVYFNGTLEIEDIVTYWRFNHKVCPAGSYAIQSGCIGLLFENNSEKDGTCAIRIYMKMIRV